MPFLPFNTDRETFCSMPTKCNIEVANTTSWEVPTGTHVYMRSHYPQPPADPPRSTIPTPPQTPPPSTSSSSTANPRPPCQDCLYVMDHLEMLASYLRTATGSDRDRRQSS